VYVQSCTQKKLQTNVGAHLFFMRISLITSLHPTESTLQTTVPDMVLKQMQLNFTRSARRRGPPTRSPPRRAFPTTGPSSTLPLDPAIWRKVLSMLGAGRYLLSTINRELLALYRAEHPSCTTTKVSAILPSKSLLTLGFERQLR
jgi:hypothetical protein